MAVVKEKGSISIHTENIFPIIKKFLYSDHEIFLRELVSNAVSVIFSGLTIISGHNAKIPALCRDFKSCSNDC